MTTAIAGYGIRLQRSPNGSGYVTVAEVTNVTPPAAEMEFQDASAHDGAGWREYIPTLLDLDEFTITINFVPTGATHTNLMTDLIAGTLLHWKVIYPNAGSTDWDFRAYVKRFAVQGTEVDGKLTAQVTFRPSQAAAPTLS